MSLEKLIDTISSTDKTEDILTRISQEKRETVGLEGVAPSAKSLFIASVFKQTGRSMLFLTYSLEEAERIAEHLPHYGVAKHQALFYPASDVFIYEDGRPDSSVVGERLNALRMLASGTPVIVIAPVEAALRRTMSCEELSDMGTRLSVGEDLDTDDFLAKLVAMGYESTDVVDRHGEFSRRGGIIDIYSANEDDPVRIELFGDEIESIRHFDSRTQRSIDKIKEALILPTREILLTPKTAEKAAKKMRKDLEEQAKSIAQAENDEAAARLRERVEDHITRLENCSYFDDMEYYLPYLHNNESSIFDFLPQDSLLIVDEPGQIKSHWEHHESKVVETLINRASKGLVLASSDRQHVLLENTVKSALAEHGGLVFTLLPRPFKWAPVDYSVEIDSAAMDSFGGRVEAAMDQVRTWKNNGLSVVIASSQDQRMGEILSEHGIDSTRLDEVVNLTDGVFVAHSPLRAGYKLGEAGLMVVSDSEIFGSQQLTRPRKPTHEGVPVHSILDLAEGDYVVHINHGIAHYRGIQTLKAQGVEREFLLLEYAGKDKLYVPTDQIERVQKYIGGEGNAPAVHKLGGAEWSRTTRKVKKAVEEIAKELVELYAWRQALEGHAFGPDTPWQQEMESAFPYVETPDQMSAITEVKSDLAKPKAMDRLVCGDVGYGKTEVALRAAFKVISEGKQVAVLCPTTVLAQQHFTTFTQRLAAFPIKIEMLSRFRTSRQMRETAEGLKYGTVDIVIGTHRVLSKDVEFSDLGLLIVDEEQRFGVRHKEKLKQLRKTVDVLTLTATPIPRTLHMSLAGIRDMSVINDPPEGRMPIKTQVIEANSHAVRNALVRELDRGGQVFFVHNRVENITFAAEEVRKLVPYARIGIAHGQMTESELERVMMDFYEHKYDILVCTTIIESGLDVQNANTIVINEADKLGLAQLYQLRGRVGRSDRQAYAYMLFKPEKQLSEVAEKRLAAIREFTDLGSGFRIAMRDLEIRGAGNLLGDAQSGNIAAIGFDLYSQLLAKSVSEMKGEEPPEVELPPVDLPVDAYIPKNYMPTEAHRILFYKKMSTVKHAEDVQAVQDEIEDRYGDPPRPVWHMLAVLRMRVRCRELGIAQVWHGHGQVHLDFDEDVRLTAEARSQLARAHKKHYWQLDKVILNPALNRIISETEDIIEELAPVLTNIRIKLSKSRS